MTRSILALAGEAYGGGGGIAQYNRDVFEALSVSGAWTIDILPRHGGGGEAPPPGVAQAPPIAARLPYVLRAITKALRDPPGVVFCGHLFMAPLAGLLARLGRASLVIQVHGIEAWRVPGALVREAVAGADLVFCVSRHTRAEVLSWSDIPPERVVVASNTVRDSFQPGDRAACRDRLDLGDRQVMLAVGRLDSRERYKGHDLVIAALPQLIAAGLDPLFLIAGDGDDRARLEGLVAKSGVGDHVRFLGQVAHDALPDLYRAADLFVLPSTGEGFGIVFLEAMCCGTPALGLAAGGAVDALGDGELGEASSPEGLAERLILALKAPRRPDLPDAVRSRFGKAVFAQRIGQLMARLEEKAAA